MTALRPFAALLASTALLLAGNALQTTLIGVRADLEGFGGLALGLTMAAYFVGYVFGGLYTPKLVDRVGHIRAFGVLATIASATALVYSLFPFAPLWIVLRLVGGACAAGLYLIIESWLNGSADNESRGGLLSVYFTLNFGVCAAAQYLLLLAPPEAIDLFILSSVLLSFALVPVGLTKAVAPQPPQGGKLSFRALYRVSPLGVVGGLGSGLTNGVFWGLGAVYVQQRGFDATVISLFMSAVIVGGMLAQTPLGRLSDRMDRRIVIVGGAIALTGACIAFGLGFAADQWTLIAGALVIGGALMTQYSLCVAHTNDFAKPEDFVTVASGLVVLYGVGAAIGPIVAAPLMDAFGPNMLFFVIAVVSGLLALFGLYRMTRRAAPADEQNADFAPTPVTPAVAALDPRAVTEDGPTNASERPAS